LLAERDQSEYSKRQEIGIRGLTVGIGINETGIPSTIDECLRDYSHKMIENEQYSKIWYEMSRDTTMLVCVIMKFWERVVGMMLAEVQIHV
jgi:hypothetical protein